MSSNGLRVAILQATGFAGRNVRNDLEAWDGSRRF